MSRIKLIESSGGGESWILNTRVRIVHIEKVTFEEIL